MVAEADEARQLENPMHMREIRRIVWVFCGRCFGGGIMCLCITAYDLALLR